MITVRRTPARKARAAQLLRDARRLLNRRAGWTQGAYADITDKGVSCYCAVGALQAVQLQAAQPGPTGGLRRDEDWAIYRIAVRALAETVDPAAARRRARAHAGFDPVVIDWNDADGRRKRDVIAAFDAAIGALA